MEFTEDTRKKLVIGALLHDIGKFIQRKGIKKKHQKVGEAFLKESGFDDIVSGIALRHHGNQSVSGTEMDVKKGNLYDWIVCLADNYSSSERSRLKSEEDEHINWNAEIPLMSVFSKINENKDTSYRYIRLSDENKIIIPEIDTKNTKQAYEKVCRQFEKDFETIGDCVSPDNLLVLLEKYLSRVPSYTAENDVEEFSPDISLFDHVKTTAAIAEVMFRYFQDTGDIPANYNQVKKATEKDMFSLMRYDISGIQDFIYTIPSKGALKNLKTRSLYVELISEHINRELLDRLELSRPCVLYAGGGGGYILCHNTESSINIIDSFFKNINEWLFEEFGGRLFVAHNYRPFSKEVFKGEKDTFSDLSIKLTESLSDSKQRKFSGVLDKVFAERDKPVSECDICNRPMQSKRQVGDENDNICQTCEHFMFFGSTLNSPHAYLVVSDNIDDERPHLKLQDTCYFFLTHLFPKADIFMLSIQTNYLTTNQKTFRLCTSGS